MFGIRIPPPVVAFAAAMAVYFTPGFAGQAPLLAGPSLVLGLCLAIAGLLIIVLAILQFRRARTTVNPLRPDKASQLVDNGIFRFSRNPMYLGMAVILLGWVSMVGSVLAMIWVLAFVGYITLFQIRPEERAMQKLFADDFTRYRQQVRRWL